MATQPLPLPSKGYQNFLILKKEYGIYNGAEFDPLIEGLASSIEDVIDGLLPARSVNLLVGDSGIGKSPLAYQLAMSVAAGVPFLDFPVRQGKVLLVDYENSLLDARRMMDQQRRHLGLDSFPKTLQVWPMNLDVAEQSRQRPEDVEEVCEILAPDLVIIDSLRSFQPGMEGDNVTAVEQIGRLRKIAGKTGTSFLLIHHVRKSSGSEPSLHGANAMDWLKSAAGVRALINQTDVRLAVEARAHDDGLVMRGHHRTRGEIGTVLMRRTRTGDGRPLGYARFHLDPATLDDPAQRVLAQLPERFTLKQVLNAYGKSRPSTRLLLQKMSERGFVSKEGFGKYRKEFR